MSEPITLDGVVRRFPSGKTRHDTPSGYRRHQIEGTDPCVPCFQAKQAYDRRLLSADDRALRNRLNAKAQGLAHAELRRKHHDEYREVYTRERARLLREAGLT